MFAPTGLNAWARLSRWVALLLGPHRDHERVGRRLQDRQPGRQYEEGDQEDLVDEDLARGDEQQPADRRQPQPGEHAGLVAEPPVDHGRRDGEREVRAVVGELDQRRLEVRHVEDRAEHADEHVGEVGRRPPRGEAADQQDERDREAGIDQPGLGLRTRFRLHGRCCCLHRFPPSAAVDRPASPEPAARQTYREAQASRRPPGSAYFSSMRRSSEGSRRRSSRILLPSVL